MRNVQHCGLSVRGTVREAGELLGSIFPYTVWRLLALHCPNVDEVVKLTQDHKIDQSFHCTVADEYGGIVGIEYGPLGADILHPEGGVYVHASATIIAEPRSGRMFVTRGPACQNWPAVYSLPEA